MKECSFRPKINRKKKFKNVESHYSRKNYDKKIEEYQERKDLIVSLPLNVYFQVSNKSRKDC